MWHKTKDAPPAITYDVFQCAEEGRAHAARRRGQRRSRQPPRRVRLLPLAPGVPRHLPRAGRRGSGHRPGYRLGRRIHGAFSATRRGTRLTSRTRSTSASVEPSIAAAGRAETARPDQGVGTGAPGGGERYRAARRRGEVHVPIRQRVGGVPELCPRAKDPGVNSLQTDMLFAELFDALAAPIGRVGCIIPTAIATGAGGQHLFRCVHRRGGVASLYDFENGSRSSLASTLAISSACSR